MGGSATSSATKPATTSVHPVWLVTPTAIRASPTAPSTNNAMSFIGGLGATVPTVLPIAQAGYA